MYNLVHPVSKSKVKKMLRSQLGGVVLVLRELTIPSAKEKKGRGVIWNPNTGI